MSVVHWCVHCGKPIRPARGGGWMHDDRNKRCALVPNRATGDWFTASPTSPPAEPKP